LTWVDTALVKEEEAVCAWGECGKAVGQISGREFGARGGEVGRQGLQGGLSLEGDESTGEIVEVIEEGGIEREAEVRKGAELGWVVRIAGGQHSGGGGRGFAERGGSLEHGNAGAVAVEFESEGEADDAGPGDANVGIRRGVMHGISLVGLRKGYSLGVLVRGCRTVCDRQDGGTGTECSSGKPTGTVI
jgi:hypothetical protein